MDIGKEKVKFNHGEAYCLMIYKCEKCNTLELLWNSRDGVTPFTIKCKECDGYMDHVMWQNDTRINENFIPNANMRVFVSMTTKDKYQYIETVINNMMKEQELSNEDIEYIKTDIMKSFSPDEPKVITGEEYNKNTLHDTLHHLDVKVTSLIDEVQANNITTKNIGIVIDSIDNLTPKPQLTRSPMLSNSDLLLGGILYKYEDVPKIKTKRSKKGKTKKNWHSKMFYEK